MNTPGHMMRRVWERAGRLFYVIRRGPQQRLYEIVSSERKFSAQLQEIKSPEREFILNELDR